MKRQVAGFVLNALLRAGIAAFLVDVLRHPHDPRYEGKAIHALLEAQEYLTDVFCGTHNVRGAWDSIGDLSSGLLGTLAYVGVGASVERQTQSA